MRIKEKRRERRADVPTSAMSDIAFLLIIFFIVATTLAEFHGFKVEIPAGQKGEQSDKTTTVKLNGKRFFIGEKEVTLPQLRKQLKALKLPEKQGQDKVIILEADESVPFQSYFAAMAAITKAGGAITIIQEE